MPKDPEMKCTTPDLDAHFQHTVKNFFSAFPKLKESHIFYLVKERMGIDTPSDTRREAHRFTPQMEPLEFTENGMVNKKHPVSDSSLVENTGNERGQRRTSRLLQANRAQMLT